MNAQDESIEHNSVIMKVQRAEEKLKDKFEEAEPCTLDMLADLYHTSWHDLKRKLLPFQTIIGKRVDGYYSVEQVQKIYLLIDPPNAKVSQETKLAIFPHNAETWRSSYKLIIGLLQKITKRILPAYYCERSVEQNRFISRLEMVKDQEVEGTVIAQLEMELVIFRHFAFYKPEIFDSSVNILERAISYYDLLLIVRNRQTINIDEHIRIFSHLLLCYGATGSRPLYCEIERLLFTHNESHLQRLFHQVAIEIYTERFD